MVASTKFVAHRLELKGIGGAPMVNVVAQTGDQKGESLQLQKGIFDGGHPKEQKAEVADGEGMAPIVVGHI